MPILDTSHDRAHPVEGDTAWSESYYFNCYDPDADVGFFTRVGVRPNEGTIDVGLSVCISTIKEDVLPVELDRAGPRRGVDLI